MGWRGFVMVVVKQLERRFLTGVHEIPEKRRGMRTTPDMMWTTIRADQVCVERVPFSMSVIIVYVVVYVRVAAVVNVVSIAHKETGAQAPVSLCAMLLIALLLTSLTLTCLTRLAGLQSLVGLTTRLATSTA